MTIQSTNLENDEFGYSCYTIVIPAPPDLTEQLLAIEHAAGQERAKIPAHVTVKGTFYGIESLDGLIEEIRNVTARHHPFTLGAEGMEPIWPGTSGVLGFPVNPAIQALHDDLVANISPLGKPAYRDDPYRVHMTIVQEVTPEGAEIARNRVAAIDLGDGLAVDSVDLMARDGVAFGGVWRRLERFRLGG
ncbi:MAG: 2'-5' RNA ligase family protein [Dehalococcoidia bacterium]|jgi:2'-5' RNA ligase|nr:2'-5' RNA ligase family protein [Dehalococcoidia bacterium]